MDKDAWLRRLYHPEPVLFIAEAAFCALALILVFVTGNEMNPVSFALYAFSTYVLGIGIYFLVLIIKHSFDWGLPRRIRENRYAIGRYVLYGELAFGLAYSVLLTVSGLDSESSWMYAAAGYYLLIALICVILLRKYIQGTGEDRAEGLRTAFHTGILMVPLTMAVITMVIMAVNGDQNVVYPDLFIYAVALFTFIFFISAIVNVIRFRGFSDPIFWSVKRFGMNRAIFSMFMLQGRDALGVRGRGHRHGVLDESGQRGARLCRDLADHGISDRVLVQGTREDPVNAELSPGDDDRKTQLKITMAFDAAFSAW